MALYPTARDSTRPTAVSAASQPDIGASANDPSSGGVLGEGFGSSVPNILLDFYLSSKNNFALTSKVLDMYAAYVDQGKVSLFEVFPGDSKASHYSSMHNIVLHAVASETVSCAALGSACNMNIQALSCLWADSHPTAKSLM